MASAAFTAAEAIERGEWDGYLEQIKSALDWRLEVLRNPNKPPPRPVEMESHQVWVWMQGPGQPHWEIRGTGAILS